MSSQKDGAGQWERCLPKTDAVSSVPVLDSFTIWFEIGAALAVGVFPNLLSAFAYSFLAKGKPLFPFWFQELSLAISSSCTIFVLLYLIYRGDETWKRFGLGPPRSMDLAIGFILLLVGMILPQITPYYRFLDSTPVAYPLARADNSSDFVIALFASSIAAFSEELVTRAYLITRLESVLRSRWQAVLIAATLFGSYHIYQGFSAVAYAIQLGVVYGIAFLMIRRIWPLAIGHLLINLYYTWLLSHSVML